MNIYYAYYTILHTLVSIKDPFIHRLLFNLTIAKSIDKLNTNSTPKLKYLLKLLMLDINASSINRRYIPLY